MTRPTEPPATPPLQAFTCDGSGGGVALDWQQLHDARGAQGGAAFLWVHLDRLDPSHQRWLNEQSGIGELPCEVLLEEETRPRQVAFDEGRVVILRGVNLNPGQEPDDMVSLRLFVGDRMVVSLRSRRVRAVEDVSEQLRAGQGPASPGDLLVAVAERIVERQLPVVESLADTVDDVEEHAVDHEPGEMRPRIAELRRTIIGLRRYLAPQRDVLTQLGNDQRGVLDDEERARMREIADAQTRIVEELDAARDRAVVANEELVGRTNERLNRNMYVLSVITGVFLPLGFVTGLLGINVGGMPGVENDRAFAIVCGMLMIVAAGVLWLFRRLRML